MLVGEQGRVIPFRHFKAVVVVTIAILLTSLSAIILLGALYIQQGRDVDRLHGEIDTLRQQTATLRDENDLLLARLVIDKGAGVFVDDSADESPLDDEPVTTERDGTAEEPAEAAAPPAPPPAPAKPQVKWQADIRQFSLEYYPDQELLEATFRIYNTTSPRQTMAGDIVLVYTNDGDPTVQRLPVPAVSLRDGIPAAGGGHDFRINNYRTMRFRAYRQKLPIAFDTVKVFVFEEGGELLLTRDFRVDIDFEPPPEPEGEPNDAAAGSRRDGQAPEEEPAPDAEDPEEANMAFPPEHIEPTSEGELP